MATFEYKYMTDASPISACAGRTKRVPSYSGPNGTDVAVPVELWAKVVWFLEFRYEHGWMRLEVAKQRCGSTFRRADNEEIRLTAHAMLARYRAPAGGAVSR